jgi:uncharacterized protein YkwD
MKKRLFRFVLFIVVLGTMNSCSSNSSAEEAIVTANSSQVIANYTYSAFEIETMKLINDYRVSIGLNALEKINHISCKSEEHVKYMIANNVVNHYDFEVRSQNIIKLLGAKVVGENIAYNYISPKGAVEAWLKSPEHKENIEGNYTHFGISIKENPETGRKYYTNIFAKI